MTGVPRRAKFIGIKFAKKLYTYSTWRDNNKPRRCQVIRGSARTRVATIASLSRRVYTTFGARWLFAPARARERIACSFNNAIIRLVGTVCTRALNVQQRDFSSLEKDIGYKKEHWEAAILGCQGRRGNSSIETRVSLLRLRYNG